MKKRIVLLLLCCFTVLLSGCGSGSTLKIDGANSEQTKAIAKVFTDLGIEVKSCEKIDTSDMPELAQALALKYTPYKVMDKDGVEYRLTVDVETKAPFTLIRQSDGEALYGDPTAIFSE